MVCFRLLLVKERNFVAKIFHYVYLGTVWCGSGNKANDCHDLGEYVETDKCCRQHDMCPYTFSKETSNYNGFSLLEYFTLSHCECDSIFRDCLHEKPYKENSYTIWSRYELLKVKCFAYLPCDEEESETEKFKNIYEKKLNRQTGTCFEGARVMVFKSIDDYTEYLKENLHQDQLLSVN